MFSPSSEVSSNRFATPIKKLKLPLCKEEVSNEGFIDKTLLKQAVMYISDNYDKQIILGEIDKLEDEIALQKFMQILQKSQIHINQSISTEQLFKLYDRGGKGYIDRDDLERVASITGIYLSKQEIDQMVNFKIMAGKVQFHEFADIMNDQNLWF